MRTIYPLLSGLFMFVSVQVVVISSHAQSALEKKIFVDVFHGQKFYDDPSSMQGKDPALVDRVKYMTGELSKNAANYKRSITFQKTAITEQSLTDCDLLFIHMPSTKFSEEEVKAIRAYLTRGGSLFIVMEVDYWSTLDQSNVNDIISSFGVKFKSDNPDTESSGGHSKEGTITSKRFSIPYHGARLVEGGNPFAYSNASDNHPFGVYADLPSGGKIVAMGDGMVSLYMTSWKDVSGYQCSEFMNEVIGWLLK